MTEDVYHKLAQTLDAIPHGFPATESGAELRLLAKIFTQEEAALAAVMRLDPEPVDQIAARAGADPETAYHTLKAMARKGLIRFDRKGRQLAFGLMPFAVGFYEEQLPRMDRELAELFEGYYQEIRGLFSGHAPPIQRVIPVEEAIPAGIEVYPYERASELLENAKAWGVRDCICRVQQKLVGRGCDRPVENCLSFGPVEGLFDRSETTRAISKEEALRLLREAEEAGLVHSPGNYRDGNYYICNCCTCCCGVLRSVAEFSIPTAIAKSDFYAVVDAAACAGCGDCLERCQFGALAVPEDVCVVDAGCCVGCGLCATVCPTEALYLERRPEGEIPPPPADYTDWLVQRARARGL
jgi:H+/Na+-translocating ferredoxin:NAD+ oxidoreductase subunit B